ALAVVGAVAGLVLLRRGEALQRASRRIEEIEARAGGDDQPALSPHGRRGDELRRRPGPVLAGRRRPAMDPLGTNLDPVEFAIARMPARPLAQLVVAVEH